MKNNKNFIYGIAVVTFGAMTIGWIEKGSWDWGGTKPRVSMSKPSRFPTPRPDIAPEERAGIAHVQPYPAGL